MDYAKIARFIDRNPDITPDRLLLNAGKYTEIDVKVAANTLIVREKLRHKLPEWYACKELVFINTLSFEQSSSEASAKYKASLIDCGETVADLTGGLGVDSYYFSKRASKVYYFERNEKLCESTKYNFERLRADNIIISNAEISDKTVSESLSSEISTIYIDPSRREKSGKRTYAITDYEPNILEIKEKILSAGKRLIIKVSPMLDISAALELLPESSVVHVVSVDNECKELLFILEPSQSTA